MQKLMKMTGPGRTILAFITAPIVASTTLGVMTILSGNTDFISVIALVFVFYFYCAAPLLLFGVPVYFLLRSLNCVNLWSVLISGVGIGVVSALALRFPAVPEPRDLKILILAGGLASFVFWIIWSSGPRDSDDSDFRDLPRNRAASERHGT